MLKGQISGVFVHWILCLGIFVAGMLMNGAMAFPQIQPLAMIGGCCFAMGKLFRDLEAL